MKVLAVCTGNTCRSPMIMALVKKLHPSFEVDSAGIYALCEEISHNSVLALAEEGIDLSGYISKPLTQEMLDEADVIITATQEHKALLKNFLKGQRVFSLDCPDPFGQDLETYIKTKNDILAKLKEISFD